MALQSMTGFAALTGEAGGFAWEMDARSVNARGLDLRLRLPDGAEALDPKIRAAAKRHLTRGAVQIGLRLRARSGDQAMSLNADLLDALLSAIAAAESAARDAGVTLAPTAAGAIVAHKGMLDGGSDPAGLGAVVDDISAQIDAVFETLCEHRRGEGQALVGILTGQVDQVADLVARARTTAEARAARAGDLLRSRVATLLEAQDAADPDRLAQELALLAVKADVTEELDRLDAHVSAARALLSGDKPAGRKLDFLMQEFNREANTLCSKAQDTALTGLGLELKVVIDQMREQCQNLE